MTRLLYSLAWWLALPLVLVRLWLRGRREPGYRRHLAERVGFYAPGTPRPTIWVHAVSVGETRAAQPLVDALLAAYPRHALLLTHMTPTGRDTGRMLFASHGPRVVQAYLPYDTGWMTGRFLRRFRPAACILMETEVWPNMIAQCRHHAVPVALVNARLSERSLARARRLSGLMREAARGIDCIAAQTEADAQRLRALGAPNVHVTGSIKFDVAPPMEAIDRGMALRAAIGARPVLVCASTRDGEEAMILAALRLHPPGNALVILVPRHPQRFDEVARMIVDGGWRMQRRSAGDAAVAPETQLLLGDSMGEMFAYYAACDLAFIGGSLLPLGGQNLIEACAVGKPVLVGPHTFNFSQATDEAIDAGAALRVRDADEMLERALGLLRDDAQRAARGVEAERFARRHRGATQRTMALLQEMMPARIES